MHIYNSWHAKTRRTATRASDTTQLRPLANIRDGFSAPTDAESILILLTKTYRIFHRRPYTSGIWPKLIQKPTSGADSFLFSMYASFTVHVVFDSSSC